MFRLLCCSITLVFFSMTTMAGTAEYRIKIGDKAYRCSIGKSGLVDNKREGDGGTPAGTFPLRRVFYRADRIDSKNIVTKLPVQALSKSDGWCDDVTRPEYNTYVKLPFAGRHENLWLKEPAYDLIIVVGYNDNPVVKGNGSAIFIHIASENYGPTAGCIGLKKADLLEILPHLTTQSVITLSHGNEFILRTG